MSDTVETLPATPTAPMDELASASAERPARWLVPSMDVQSRGDDLRLQFDVPGARIETLDVRVEGRALMVEAPRADRPALGWRRRVALPERVDADGISAHVAHGVLTLTLPARPRHAVRRIPIAG